jgi:hypothetical protein
MFYVDAPCEWCGKVLLTLLVETPHANEKGEKIEQYSYLCLECITETHNEAVENLPKRTLTRIK